MKRHKNYIILNIFVLKKTSSFKIYLILIDGYMNRVLKKIKQDNKELITSEELKNYCRELYFNHNTISNYLISRNYLVNIMDNIYYVKSNDEINKNVLNKSTFELIGKALKKKHINNWYFALYTALDILKIKHEHENKFCFIVNDRILKNKPVKIFGKHFRFLMFKRSFFNFGIINGKFNYSDLEKTILDLIYLWEINHYNENRIVIELSKLMNGISKKKIVEYSKYYPKSNIQILEKAFNKM